MKKIIYSFCVLLFLILPFSCKLGNTEKIGEVEVETESRKFSVNKAYKITNVYPHDTSCYTQGLVWFNNFIYESTGQYNRSRIRKSVLKNGNVLKEILLRDQTIFGEGLTIFKERIYQLTWQSHTIYVYDLNSFKKLQEYYWPYEGWGITHNDSSLLISTGGSSIFYVDPNNLNIEKKIEVQNEFGYVSNLNELEYANNSIYANRYETNDILIINPNSGAVEFQLDMTGILSKCGVKFDKSKYEIATGNVLNGIAYDVSKDCFYITGKLWPVLFEIKLN